MCRWTGDAVKVQALAKTVVKTRTHGETGEPANVMIPDHLDVLAELACGAQAHMVISDVIGMQKPPLHACKTSCSHILLHYIHAATVTIRPCMAQVTANYTTDVSGGGLGKLHVELHTGQGSSWV